MSIVSKEELQKMSVKELKIQLKEAKQQVEYWNTYERNPHYSNSRYREVVDICEQVLKEREKEDS